eukprot:TRINITY_DN8682_c0_g1_i1.p1 TRINITY_DN8682_c0_g1~~TRINITY_DN8682_c0_g1_i1.p1  ORF type:complete len:307 (-),score=8.89 TRINITY_DN8682_c0_g1_i1:1076-1996(-)
MKKRPVINTIEDPIEFVHRSKNSLINQRELGHDTWSFGAALRSALREDPDVILVGEMRDLETVSLALTAAETGHLVLSTLHTSSATKSIDRVIDMFPKEQQNQVRSMLSETLVAVVAQTLLQKKDGKGRVPAMEIMVANNAVANLIREEKTYQIPSVIQSGTKEGMQSLDQSLYNLVMNGHIDRNTAEKTAENPKMFASNAGFQMRFKTPNVKGFFNNRSHRFIVNTHPCFGQYFDDKPICKLKSGAELSLQGSFAGSIWRNGTNTMLQKDYWGKVYGSSWQHIFCDNQQWQAYQRHFKLYFNPTT